MKLVLRKGVPLLLLAGLAFVVWLFLNSNAHMDTDLQLDLFGLGTWHLVNPVPITTLVLISFLVGFVLGALPLGVKAMRQARRLKSLERAAIVSGDDHWP